MRVYFSRQQWWLYRANDNYRLECLVACLPRYDVTKFWQILQEIGHREILVKHDVAIPFFILSPFRLSITHHVQAIFILQSKDRQVLYIVYPEKIGRFFCKNQCKFDSVFDSKNYYALWYFNYRNAVYSFSN